MLLQVSQKFKEEPGGQPGGVESSLSSTASGRADGWCPSGPSRFMSDKTEGKELLNVWKLYFSSLFSSQSPFGLQKPIQWGKVFQSRILVSL